jgi:TM2 domain-containing membrane protein YozV
MRKALTTLTLIGIVAFSSFGGEGDSAVILNPQVASYDFDAIPKDPLASAFFSATIPGSGQVYNKEYTRGILTAAGFYAGFYLTQYMLARWDALNTDTVYFKETDQYGNYYGQVRSVYVARDADRQVGLPAREKIVLGASVAMTAGFWVWAVYDAYQGAKRYNNKLTTAQTVRRLELRPAYVPGKEEAKLTAVLKF